MQHNAIAEYLETKKIRSKEESKANCMLNDTEKKAQAMRRTQELYKEAAVRRGKVQNCEGVKNVEMKSKPDIDKHSKKIV